MSGHILTVSNGAGSRGAAAAVVRGGRCGSVAGDTLTEARERCSDLVVVGCTAHTGLRVLLVGSVSRAVVRQSARPVVVVHEPASGD